jgi:hypothetical protein
MPNEDVADIPAGWRDLHLAANCAGPLASALPDLPSGVDPAERARHPLLRL